jgi:hypothetical protein
MAIATALASLTDMLIPLRAASMIEVSLVHTWLQQTHIDHA